MDLKTLLNDQNRTIEKLSEKNGAPYMSDQEFTAHIAALIPTPSAEANGNLLSLANSLWFKLKENLYHIFCFISRHFTLETLQSVYDLCKERSQGILTWELLGTAIYLQAGTPLQEIGKQEWKEFPIFPTPQAPDTLSTMGICTVRENGTATQFYTLHFGQFDHWKLLDKASALAESDGITVTKAMGKIGFDMRIGYVADDEAAVCGPQSPMAERLFQLMSSSPITAAHITIDVDNRNATIEINPLWEKLWDERGISPPARQRRSSGNRSIKHKNEPDR